MIVIAAWSPRREGALRAWRGPPPRPPPHTSPPVVAPTHTDKGTPNIIQPLPGILQTHYVPPNYRANVSTVSAYRLIL
ncbi:hypothetical protein JYU34_011662 [Plutella xylostella]|uniref:Uncharacterized protein n=1 Tax=Plutella xylostella TaxID=51655 RepID=A0ABQ7QDR7_PLUXY|nr:hypothetical protein JYU34_011662 [Plutella xylostella]